MPGVPGCASESDVTQLYNKAVNVLRDSWGWWEEERSEALVLSICSVFSLSLLSLPDPNQGTLEILVSSGWVNPGTPKSVQMIYETGAGGRFLHCASRK